MRATALLAALALSSLVAACSGGDDDDDGDDRLRGGGILVTVSSVAGFDPADDIAGIGAFFEPPGPEPTPWPEVATCEWTTPLPDETATPSPTPTPQVGWRDAGELVTLRSEANALRLDRFEGPNGEIYYLAPSDAEPDSFPLGVPYDIEIAGSNATNGIAATTLVAALDAPAPLDLYAPVLMDAPIELPRTALQIGWVPGDVDHLVRVQVVVSGSAGSATLTCAAEDGGFFEIPASQMEMFPSGGGALTVSRRALHETRLADDTWLDAEVVLVEGGAILLP